MGKKIIVRSSVSGMVNEVKMWWLVLFYQFLKLTEQKWGRKCASGNARLQRWFCSSVLSCWNVSTGPTSQLWWWRPAGWRLGRESSWLQIQTRPVGLWWTSWRFVTNQLISRKRSVLNGTVLQDRAFGAAGETVVVEELLEGEEVSVRTAHLQIYTSQLDAVHLNVGFLFGSVSASPMVSLWLQCLQRRTTKGCRTETWVQTPAAWGPTAPPLRYSWSPLPELASWMVLVVMQLLSCAGESGAAAADQRSCSAEDCRRDEGGRISLRRQVG